MPESLPPPSSSSHHPPPSTINERSPSVLGGDCLNRDINEKYELLETIGEGTFGVVRKCRDRETGQMCAAKTILKSKVPNLDLLQKEVDLLSEVEHPHIIKLYDAFEEETKLHLVTELCTGGELYDRVVEKSLSPEQHFSEYDAARILRNILDAIAYCHDEKNICHRDLKVENFLLLNERDDSPVKIIDFGLSRFNPDNVMTTRVGTVYYVAPEVVLSKEYSDKCDIWSIGVIAYVLLCGFPPFLADNEYQTLQMVKDENTPIEFPSPIWDDVSQEARDFILRLLHRDPSQRPSAREALKDPWLNHRHVQPKGLPRGASFVAKKKKKNKLFGVGGGQHHDPPHRSQSAPVTDKAHLLRRSGNNAHKNVQMASGRRERFQRFLQMIKLRKRSPTADTIEEQNDVIE